MRQTSRERPDWLIHQEAEAWLERALGQESSRALRHLAEAIDGEHSGFQASTIVLAALRAAGTLVLADPRCAQPGGQPSLLGLVGLLRELGLAEAMGPVFDELLSGLNARRLLGPSTAD